MSRGSGRGRGWRQVALAVVVAVHLAGALYPFRLDLPGPRANGAQRGVDGTLRFTGPGVARSPEHQPVVPRGSGAAGVVVDIEVRAGRMLQLAPILTISGDLDQAVLRLLQDDGDLVVRLPDSSATASATTGFSVPGAFPDKLWHRFRIGPEGPGVAVWVDGERKATRPGPPVPPDADGGRYRLSLGGEVFEGRPWVGEIRDLEIAVGDRSTDYLAPSNLEVPARFWYSPTRLADPIGRPELASGSLHLAAFVPLGFMLVMARRRAFGGARAIVAYCFVVALALQLGKVAVAGRHPRLVDLVLDAAGAVVGGLAARRLTSDPG